jgi:hypothetical protein
VTGPTEPNELEQRLGAGLKRWAEAGQPTLALETYVRTQVANKRRRTWLRWAGTAAAAAALVVGLGATFPKWAGAASGLPLVGPVVTEIIMKDAGLKWAYDNDLLQGAVAEAQDGAMTVRILGVLAGPVRTTVVYQITGVDEPPAGHDRPVRAGDEGLAGRFSHPATIWPEFSITELPGRLSYFTSQSGPMATPVGLVGTFETAPLGVEEGTIKLDVTYQDHAVSLAIPVSRAVVDRVSKTVPVGESQTVGDITITVDSVIHTPVDTVVQYRVEKPKFTGGGWGWSGNQYSVYAEGPGGNREYGRKESEMNGISMLSLPVVAGPSKLVFPLEVKGVPADLRWPLAKGAVAEARGVPVTLKDWSVSGEMLYLEWEHAAGPSLFAFGPVEVLDADGNAHAVEENRATWYDREGLTNRAVELKLPEGVVPVAVRAGTVAVGVTGPWVFDLPAR